MTDLVERLRQEAHDTYSEIDAPDCLWWEAADEIERLRERLTEAENRQGLAEHMQANLHSHIKRLEDENADLKQRLVAASEHDMRERSALRAENAKLRVEWAEDANKVDELEAENAKLREALECIAKQCTSPTGPYIRRLEDENTDLKQRLVAVSEQAAKFVEENYEEPFTNIVGNESWRERGPKNLAAAIRAMQSIPQSSTPAQSDDSSGSHNAHAPDAPDSSVYHKRGT